MSKYPKTLAAAGRESNGLKDLAAALWVEIPAGKRGGDEGREAEIKPALEEAQRELAAAGFDYALSRLTTLRQVAGFVADGQKCDVTSLPWRDVPYSVHEEIYRDRLSLSRLDALIAEDERVTVDSIRDLVGKKRTRPAKTSVEAEIATASPEEGKEIVESIISTKEGRKAVIETLAERDDIQKDIKRRADVVGKKTKTPKPDKSADQAWEDWLTKINTVLLDGAKLAADTDLNELGALATLAVEIYQRITDRKLDVEIRDLLEAGVER